MSDVERITVTKDSIWLGFALADGVTREQADRIAASIVNHAEKLAKVERCFHLELRGDDDRDQEGVSDV